MSEQSAIDASSAGNWLVQRFMKGEIGGQIKKLRKLYLSDHGKDRELIEPGLLDILQIGERERDDGETLAWALWLAGGINCPKVNERLQELVYSRQLVGEIGGYNDLHGRALVALDECGQLDLQTAWYTECRHHTDGYLPLVFALRRGHCTDFRDIQALAKMLPAVAQHRFIKEALESCQIELSAEHFRDLMLVGDRLMRQATQASPDSFWWHEWQAAVAEVGQVV